jgi:hypothetical protein
MTKVNESSPQVPTISHDVADAIVWMKGTFGATNTQTILRSVLDSNVVGPKTVMLRSIPFDTLLAALVNGYNVELTPEEAAEKVRQEAYDKLAAEYKRYRDLSLFYQNVFPGDSARRGGFADGIRFAVRTLKLNIPEVSA